MAGNEASRFEGKVAVVTGSGKGIGAAVAKALGREGAKVAAVDIDRAAAESTVGEIGSAGGEAVALQGSVSVAADVERFFDEAAERFGGVDLLANIAGVVRYGEVTDFSEDDWDFVVDTNLKGPFLTTRSVVPLMRARGGGSIVHVSSVQAFASQQLVAAYSASKGGVLSLTKTLALDHAKDNIRVNCIAPGSVRTPMLRQGAELFGPDDPEGTEEEWGRNHPIGRLIEPHEVAEVVLFLLSDAASVVTGACYLADGGLISRLGV